MSFATQKVVQNRVVCYKAGCDYKSKSTYGSTDTSAMRTAHALAARHAREKHPELPMRRWHEGKLYVLVRVEPVSTCACGGSVQFVMDRGDVCQNSGAVVIGLLGSRFACPKAPKTRELGIAEKAAWAAFDATDAEFKRVLTGYLDGSTRDGGALRFIAKKALETDGLLEVALKATADAETPPGA